ncbi:hypothetical protein EVAR_4127_1 [Eumeta japonica]|uniref:Uncharacterized protein n=1 Tax=Eumeta variegata TaxID=151549 RepID=A0A4C1ZYT1_EUMVA|nr:hypothetical protein EVAR_4127_1 [Eumeta japonica]
MSRAGNGAKSRNRISIMVKRAASQRIHETNKNTVNILHPSLAFELEVRPSPSLQAKQRPYPVKPSVPSVYNDTFMS